MESFPPYRSNTCFLAFSARICLLLARSICNQDQRREASSGRDIDWDKTLYAPHGTIPDDLFAAGPAHRSLVEHEKSGMIEAEKGRGDLSSLGRTQITETGIDPVSRHTRQIPVYWWNLGKSRSMCFHDASHRFTVVRSARSRGREIAREELFV